MLRILASAVISLLSNALGLLVAANLLDGMSLGVSGFVIAVLIYTGITILTEPLLRQVALKNAPALLGSSSLIAVLISLAVTTVISDSLTIGGVTNWVLATIIVWAVALAGRLLLPMVIFKQVMAENRERRG
ncbi:MAG: hypothetical protein KF906_08290 [Actinobacteria bacterium]|nr:hypothetical protein [Actinomycetota bacterium]